MRNVTLTGVTLKVLHPDFETTSLDTESTARKLKKTRRLSPVTRPNTLAMYRAFHSIATR